METTKEKPKNVKMNLSLDQEFYQLLKDNAKADYIQVATWVKQFLMKNLAENHNEEVNFEMENGRSME